MTVLKETTYNKRAGKHTFVVRAYKARSGKVSYYMRVGNKFFVFNKNKEWTILNAYNEGLQTWAKKVFGINLVHTRIKQSKPASF